MLIYSKHRVVPTDLNMMVISDVDDDGYFYIHRLLYDQAVIISDIYGDDYVKLALELTGVPDTREDVDTFFAKAPRPINILAPFLLYVKKPLTEFEDMVGAIHVMSGPVNLRALLKYPREIRNTPSFSLSIKEEYQLAWDRFFQTASSYGVNANYASPMNGTYTETVPVTDYEEVKDATEPVTTEEGLADFEAEIQAMLAAEMASATAEYEALANAEEEEETEEVPSAVATPKENTVPPKNATGIDLLRGGYY